jgi:hypothetical protein
VLTATAAANGSSFTGPLDAALISDASTIYFTAQSTTGAGVFSFTSGSALGSATAFAVGAPFVAPFGIAISGDDTTAYVADPASSDQNFGEIAAVDLTAGTITPIAGTANTAPIGIAISTDFAGTDTLYFTGVDILTGDPGVFSLDPSVGTVTTVFEGAPLVKPSGVAAVVGNSATTVYVLDAEAAGTVIYQLTSGAPTVLAGPLPVGFPSGVDSRLDGSALLVSGFDPVKASDVVYSVALPGGAVTQLALTALTGFNESGGLHRAQLADSFAFVDGTANSTGTIFQIQ